MSYVFEANFTPGNYAISFYNLKEKMKVQGWTVESSGDGLAAYSSSGDIITHGGGGANGLYNNRAWFRIRQPLAGAAPFDLRKEFVFQRANGDTGTSRDWRMKFTYDAAFQFTGGSPSANTVPAATNEWVFHGSGTDASPYGPSYFNQSENQARAQLGVGDAANDKSSFFMFHYPIGGGDPTSMIIYDHIVSGSFPFGTVGAQDNDPFMFYGTRRTSTPDDMRAEGGGWAGWIRYGLSGPSHRNIGAGFLVTAGGTCIPETLAANSHSLKDNIFPLNWAVRWPLGAPAGWKGTSYMTKWNGTNRATGDTLTVSTPGDRVVADSINFPWNGTVPII